jgi:hypothetical protein
VSGRARDDNQAPIVSLLLADDDECGSLMNGSIYSALGS